MLLIVGLGNPGPEYARHRHNVGFIAVDAIHRRQGFGPWRRRFSGEFAEGLLAGERAFLLKPATFMNDSGRSVQEAARFYRLEPKDIVVIHDEVDLPPGKTRMKTGGGAAGHNGLRSLDAAIGQDYRRLRIGVGHPGLKEAVPGYVLHDFPKGDAEWLVPLIDAIADNAVLFAEGKDNTMANRLHALTTPEKAAKETEASANTSARKVDGNPKVDGDAAQAEGPLARNLKKLFGL